MSMDKLDRMNSRELLLSAIIAGEARFEKLCGEDDAGELCIGSLRYFCYIDSYGLPMVPPFGHNELVRSLQKRRSKRFQNL